MPMPRKSQVSVDTTLSYHVVSCDVCRTFLFGVVDNQDFGHRRERANAVVAMVDLPRDIRLLFFAVYRLS